MSSFVPQIYRYDHILGLAGSELNSELFWHWGRALAGLSPKNTRLIVSGDNRRETRAYKEALISGLVDQGITVLDFGVVPADFALYAQQRFQAGGAVSVGGGARPPTWNGLRWKLRDVSLSLPEQVRCLQDESESRGTSSDAPLHAAVPGTVRKIGIADDWISWLQTVWYDVPEAPFHILVDPMYGNWSHVAVRALRTVFPRMTFDSIHDEPDEDFGGVIPNANYVKSIAGTCAEVRHRNADMGVVFGVDASHFTLIDEQGVPLLPEEIAWIFLHHLLGVALVDEVFLHDVHCSEILIEEGRRQGGRPAPATLRKESFVEEMQRTNALLGIGSGGEIYFRGVQGNRIVMFAFCWFLDFFSRLGISLSEWRKTIPGFFTTSEFRTPFAPLDEVAERLSGFYGEQPTETLDGIRFQGPFGRVDIRSIPDYSQLGFHFESTNQASLNRLVRGCSTSMENFDHIGLFLEEQFMAETTGKSKIRNEAARNPRMSERQKTFTHDS